MFGVYCTVMNRSNYFWNTTFTVSIATSVVACATPSLALQATVKPEKPVLGDTLSVMIQPDSGATLDSTPTVIAGGRTYASFKVGPDRWRALLPTTPLEKSGARRVEVKAGKEVRNLAVWVGDRKFPTQRIWLPANKASVEATELELSRVGTFKQLVTPQKFWSGPFLQPNKGRSSTGYGVRRYYNGKFANDYYHRGVDYAGSAGSAVVAPAAGRVALVGQESQGFRIHGNVVGLDHGQGVTSIFLHLSRIHVKQGEMVKPGQLIGAVGSTGASTGPHLHWGLYVNGQSVDPVPWRYQSVE